MLRNRRKAQCGASKPIRNTNASNHRATPSLDGSYPRENTERIPRKSATDIHSDLESFDPLGQLPDVEIDQETNRAAGELEV